MPAGSLGPSALQGPQKTHCSEGRLLSPGLVRTAAGRERAGPPRSLERGCHPGRCPRREPSGAGKGWKSPEAQARGEPRRSSPSGSTALRSASTAAATAAHAIRPQSEPPRCPRAPPLWPRLPGAPLTSHPAEGGGEGARRRFGQSRAGDRRPRPLPRGNEGSALARPREPRAWRLERRAPRLGRREAGRRAAARLAGTRRGCPPPPDPRTERGWENA